MRYSTWPWPQDEQRSTRLYSVSARFMNVRDAYYAALERTSAGPLDITPWLVWFLAQMQAAIRSSESIIEAVLTRTRFWMQHSRAEVSGRQLKALGRMLDTLPQEFVGGMTNKKYAHLTGASPATAQRDLADLVSKGYLVLRGAGRSARYELAGVERGAGRSKKAAPEQ